MLDLVIKNGKLVFDTSIVSADIAVKGDKIWATQIGRASCRERV